jgi:hypothetical protein
VNSKTTDKAFISQLNQSLPITICIFNCEVWELKPKVWDLFPNFTIEKRRAVLLWSPLKDTLPVVHNLRVKFLHILELNYNRIFFEFLRTSGWLWKRILTSEITQANEFWIGYLKPESHSEIGTRRWTLNQILIIKCGNEL